MPSPNYYRRQAEMCVRLSRSASGEVALRLVAMAEDYAEKAETLERGQSSLPAYMEVIRDAARQ